MDKVTQYRQYIQKLLSQYAKDDVWVPSIRRKVCTGSYKRCLGEGRRFLGVYSGRVGDDNFQAQLGIVWKSAVIEEIIQAAQVGESSFELSCSN